MPTQNELKALAKLRLKEAQSLHAQSLYDGACYLGGYAIELAFKARICKLLKVADYPEEGKLGQAFKIHKLEDLVFLAGLKAEWVDKKLSNIPFKMNSDLVFDWSEAWRYLPQDTKSQANSQDFLAAVEDIFTWIKHKW